MEEWVEREEEGTSACESDMGGVVGSGKEGEEGEARLDQADSRHSPIQANERRRAPRGGGGQVQPLAASLPLPQISPARLPPSFSSHDPSHLSHPAPTTTIKFAPLHAP